MLEKYMPPNAAAHGGEIDQLMLLVHLLMAALFVGWSIYYVYVLYRFRAKKNPVASYTGSKGKVAKGVEVGVAVVEALLLVVYAVPAWANRVDDFPAESDATVVHVVAQQFAWNIHYAGKDGVFGRRAPELVGSSNVIGLDREDPFAKDDIVTINQLHLPVDKPVIVHLSTLDVIHGFALPQMRVKQDAIPGMTIPVWFEPVETTPEGEIWNIACAQLCGNSHYSMRGYYTIHDREGYERWLADNAPAVPEPAPAVDATTPDDAVAAIEAADEGGSDGEGDGAAGAAAS